MFLNNMKILFMTALLHQSVVFAHPEHSHRDERIVVGAEFDRDHAQPTTINSIAGPVLKVKGHADYASDPLGESLRLSGPGLDGPGAYVLVADAVGDVKNMPVEAFTATAWVRIDEPTRWGGIISAVSDNGDREKGWVLGYDNDSFTFGIASTGADDGNGLLTYLDGQTHYELGHWYMVTATFDGKSAKLYVNAKLDAQTDQQHGKVLYENKTPLAIGAYIDSNELHPMNGRIRNAYLFNQAMSPEQINFEFKRNELIAQIKPTDETPLEWVVDPFLCYATQHSISIVCEVPIEAGVRVRYRPATGDVHEIESSPKPGIHTIEINGLQPGQPYYYEVIAETADGQRIETDPLSFQTAPERGKAFTFIMIGDTQAHPEVVKRVSDLSWENRPNFVCVAGDLVTTGTNKSHWTHHFFPHMQPLISRIPLFPVLGNHEQNSHFYYDYMNLPDPEYYYSYRYGDADFFVLDSEKPMGPTSEQYTWLKKQLQNSDARWKFVIHHRPAYSSDSNDYGNTYLGPTTLGDLNVRQIVPLYEEYGVDIVFNGHIHAYERTFPIRAGEAVENNGVVYITTGGGGGDTESFAPFNPWFGSKKLSLHHICRVEIVGGRLRLQSIDEYGKLFDTYEIRK